MLDAGGIIRSVFERDGTRWLEVRREHDAMHRLVRVIDPLGHDAFTNVYDLWGNRIRIRSADGGDMRFVFDNERREVERIDADGHRLVSLRDSRGRVTELRDGSGSAIERYEYDTGTGDNLAGRLARVSGSFGTVEYSYTVEGEATRITRTVPGQVNPFTIRFDYNAHGDVRSVTYPDGTSLDTGTTSVACSSRSPGS